MTTDTFKRISDEEGWFNRAINGTYPPGSTFKIVTACAALRARAITPTEQFTCNGFYQVGNRLFDCHDRHAHGQVELIKALTLSCNVYFYQVGLETGVDALAEEARRFHLDRRTGIELPAEHPNTIVPDPAWKKKRDDTNWNPGDTANMSIGQGALIVFASVVFWKCRKYIFCGFRPGLLKDLEPGEQRELKLSSYLFAAASTGLILMLWLSLGANPFYTMFSFFVILVISIGLVRAVTEGGLLGFQAFASPFHFIRAFFGLNQSWCSTTLFAPVLVFYSILFLDIKTFIAPAMANSLKLRDDFKMSRSTFHLAIFLAIAAAAVTAVAAAIMMSYKSGGDSMQGWFYVGFPRSTLDTIRTMVKDAPAASPSCAWWITGGATGMGLLLYLRQFIFWLPHPIGLIMLVNPLMVSYWFSIFLGWLFNLLITRYGNKNTYQKATHFFIGLIAGELFMIIIFGGSLNR